MKNHKERVNPINLEYRRMWEELVPSYVSNRPKAIELLSTNLYISKMISELLSSEKRPFAIELAAQISTLVGELPYETTISFTENVLKKYRPTKAYTIIFYLASTLEGK